VGFDKGLDDGQAEPQTPVPIRIRLLLVEHGGKALRRNPGPVVADEAFYLIGVVCLSRTNSDLSPRCVGDGVGDQVLQNALDQAGVCEDDQVLGYGVDQVRGACFRNGMEVMDEAFDHRPEVEVPALQLDADLGFDIGIFLNDLADEGLQVLHVALERLPHLRDLGRFGLRPGQEHFQNPC